MKIRLKLRRDLFCGCLKHTCRYLKRSTEFTAWICLLTMLLTRRSHVGRPGIIRVVHCIVHLISTELGFLFTSLHLYLINWSLKIKKYSCWNTRLYLLISKCWHKLILCCLPDCTFDCHNTMNDSNNPCLFNCNYPLVDRGAI